MNRDHWQRVARVYERALDEDPSRRAAVVAAASADDEDVGREVEALLAEDASASLLDSSVWDTAAGLLDPGPDLAQGSSLGPYRIEGVIDVGGMGEVYRAIDTRLDRVVAIKILPAAFASNPRFRERFEREARAIAALGHPHICALYDVGRERVRGAPGDEALDFLVLEFVEGETLAARLRRGQLPIAEALRYASQIAEALAAAHRRGVIHRDLKPSNIMIAGSGAKLLDFGLAKLEVRSQTSTELTTDGAILGTFQYMAPEQVEGRAADARTDIFALGAVIYEMITGHKAFAGTSRAALIGAILKDDPPPLSRDQPLAPPLLDHIVRRCLAKDPEERWQSAADLARELRWAAERPAAAGRRSLRPLRAAAAFTVLVAAVSTAAFLYLRSDRPVARPYRLSVVLPEGTSVIPVGPTSRFALAPDGQRLAFVASREGVVSRLYVRRLDRLEAEEIAGTEDAQLPFWSPDGSSVGFIAGGALKRVDLDNGSIRTLTSTAARTPAAWSHAGVILFTPTRTSRLHRIAASGGSPVAVTIPDARANELAHVAPVFLPDGNRFFYVALTGTPSGRTVAAATYLAGLDDRGNRRLVLKPGSNVAYANGHLLYARESTLVAQPFDLQRLELTGEPLAVAERVTHGGYLAYGQGLAFSASEEGTIAYQTGEPAVELTWFDRSGRKLRAVGEPLPPDAFADVALSRDARAAAVTTYDARAQAFVLWRYDLERGFKTRLAFDGLDHLAPVLSPGAQRVVFAARRRGPLDLFARAADGGGSDDLLLADDRDKYSMSWSPDGRFLLYVVNPPGELWAMPLIGDRRPWPVIRGAFSVPSAQLSPDGRWIAYASTESGRSEIYLTEFPRPRTKRPITVGGGTHPRWRGDGRELFFRASGKMMAAEVVPQTTGVTVGAPHELFELREMMAAGGSSRYSYDVTADGQRFLIGMRSVAGEQSVGRGEWARSITLLINWPAGLRNK